MDKQPKPKFYIGIDPDNQESGVAKVNRLTKEIVVSKFSFPLLVSYLGCIDFEERHLYQIVIEGGWLNKSNWHTLGKYISTQKAAAIGRSAGMNHQTGILIKEMCESMKLQVQVVKPLKKCWRGKDGKITQDEAEYFMGKLPRMNQDERDAALLAWVHAGLTVKMKPDTEKKKSILQKTIASFDG